MRRLSEQVTTPLLWTDSIPASVRDGRTNRQKRLAKFFILTSTLFERLAFYALINALFNALRMTEPFFWSNQLSKTASYTFSGTSYMSTLIFAIITDAKFGRAKTILFGFIFYSIGFILITMTTTGSTPLCHFNDSDFHNGTSPTKEYCIFPVFGTIILTALGAGAVKANLCVFGAEQIQQSKAKSRYFHYYAIAVNLGDMIATIVIPVIQYQLVHYHYIPYTIAVTAILLAFITFSLGWKYYIHVIANESVVTKICPVMSSAIRSWFRFQREEHTRERTQSGTRLRLLNGPNGPIEVEESIDLRDGSAFLDFARADNQGRFHNRIVNDVKSLRRGLLVFTLLIPFWLVYSQSSTTFPLQGENMSGSDPSYIVSFMSLGDPIVVIVGIIVINLYIYIKQLDFEHTEKTITIKFALGMIFSTLSMFVAAFVEHGRQKQCIEDLQDSKLSILAQIPQNLLIGVSQLFGMVACYEYSYLAAPISGQSLFMSLYFFSIGTASYLGIGFMYIFPRTDVDLDFHCKAKNPWYWSYYAYFYILGGIQLVFLIIFIVCQRYWNIVKLNPQQTKATTILQPTFSHG